ncbi:MAG TPA: hypothetical protein VGI22_11260 [Xanthobacteraceae bacterium]
MLIQAADLVELNSRKHCGAKQFDFISLNSIDVPSLAADGRS